jgi:hypothetical protein
MYGVDDSPTKLGSIVAAESCIGTSNSPVPELVASGRLPPTEDGRDNSSKLEILGGEATGVLRGGDDELTNISG